MCSFDRNKILCHKELKRNKLTSISRAALNANVLCKITGQVFLRELKGKSKKIYLSSYIINQIVSGHLKLLSSQTEILIVKFADCLV